VYVAFHYPFFGSSTVDGYQLLCPDCGANDWEQREIAVCNPGDEFKCQRCGKKVWINWGLVEPDHLSSWLNSEYCQHRVCRLKFSELGTKKGWDGAAHA
jgi:DNA-directed RNA polymerase subunit RPC12/RpoP